MAQSSSISHALHEIWHQGSSISHALHEIWHQGSSISHALHEIWHQGNMTFFMKFGTKMNDIFCMTMVKNPNFSTDISIICIVFVVLDDIFCR